MQRNICAGNPEESICLQENEDESETESSTRSIVDGEENPIPVKYELKASDVAMETVAVAPPVGQQMQMQDAAIEIPADYQGNDMRIDEVFLIVYTIQRKIILTKMMVWTSFQRSFSVDFPLIGVLIIFSRFSLPSLFFKQFSVGFHFMFFIRPISVSFNI